jgi:hypothetical protein
MRLVERGLGMMPPTTKEWEPEIKTTRAERDLAFSQLLTTVDTHIALFDQLYDSFDDMSEDASHHAPAEEILGELTNLNHEARMQVYAFNEVPQAADEREQIYGLISLEILKVLELRYAQLSMLYKNLLMDNAKPALHLASF